MHQFITIIVTVTIIIGNYENVKGSVYNSFGLEYNNNIENNNGSNHYYTGVV